MLTENDEMVAIGLNREHLVQKDHFGQSAFYALYNTDGKRLETRANPFYGTHKHAKAEEIQQVLPDCRYWIGCSMGKKSREHLKAQGIQTILLDKELLK